MDIKRIKIEYMPKITDDQLYDFYVRNDICEAGHGKEAAVKPLKYSPYMVGAFYEGKLVGIVRAVFDGFDSRYNGVLFGVGIARRQFAI
ncbi:MAG: hypothetical protein ACOX2V_09305 [Clostridia bacterium]